MSTPSTSEQVYQHTPLSIFSLISLALMIGVPFLVTYHMPPIASFYKEWLAAVFAVMAGVFLIGRSKAKFQFPVVAFVPLLLLVVLAAQIILLKPDYWQNQFVAMLYLGLSILLIVLAANLKHLVSLQRIVPTLAWAFVAGTTLILLLLVAGKFIGEGSILSLWILNGRAGNVGQVNHFSNFIALGLGSLLYLRMKDRVSTSTTLIISALILLGLAQAGQRMAILYVLLLSVGGWLLAKGSAESERLAIRPVMLLWLIPGFIAAQLIIPYMMFLEPAKVPAQRLMETMGTESNRLMLIEQAWLVFKQNPWLGIGWAEFPWYNFSVTEDYPSLKGLWHHSHNLFMQLLAETGLIGALILLSGMLYWFREQLLANLTIERWWILALLCVIGIHSLLEYPLWYVNFLAFASVLLGLSSERTLQGRFKLAPIFFIAVFIFGCWSLGNIAATYHQLEQTLSELREEGLPQSEIDINLIKLNELRSQTVFTPVADNFLLRVLPNSPELIADKLSISYQVVENWPGRVEVYNHAYLLAMNNHPVEAQAFVRKAIKQFPEYRESYHKFVLRQAVRGEARLLPILILLQDPYEPSDQ